MYRESDDICAYDEYCDRIHGPEQSGLCPACNGVGSDGGHHCTSYECCGPCPECDGTGELRTEQADETEAE